MKRALLVLPISAALLLGGCQITEIQKDVDKVIRSSLPEICSAATTARDTFVALSLEFQMPESASRAVETGWAILEPLCANPSAATSTSILLRAIAAYRMIAEALGRAETVSEAAGPGG